MVELSSGSDDAGDAGSATPPGPRWLEAIVFPAPEDAWGWCTARLLGLSALDRVLTTLRRAGVQRVVFPSVGEEIRALVRSSSRRAELPQIASELSPDRSAEILGVRGGLLFTVDLLRCFDAALGKGRRGACVAQRPDGSLPVLVSIPLDQALPERLTFDAFSAVSGDAPVVAPPEAFVSSVDELRGPGGRQALYATGRKPVEDLHRRIVRPMSFPLVVALAERGVTPTAVTWVSFGVALLGVAFVGVGGYALTVAGALMLYFARVLDIVDGTLARLTLAESAAGARIDTITGRLANVLGFAAVCWNVHRDDPVRAAAVYAVLLFGGVMVAVLRGRIDARAPTTMPSLLWAVRGFLENMRHREIFLLFVAAAVAGRPGAFLWIALPAVYFHAMVDLALLALDRRSA